MSPRRRPRIVSWIWRAHAGDADLVHDVTESRRLERSCRFVSSLFPVKGRRQSRKPRPHFKTDKNLGTRLSLFGSSARRAQTHEIVSKWLPNNAGFQGARRSRGFFFLATAIRIISASEGLWRSQAMPRKTGVPSEEELLDLSSELGAKWKNLARALRISEANIEVVDEENRRVAEKCYKLLLLWKQGRGSQATYEALEAGLCHGVVLRRDLAEKYCYDQAIPQEHDFMG